MYLVPLSLILYCYFLFLLFMILFCLLSFIFFVLVPKGKRKCAKWYREISNRGQRYDPVFGNQEVIVILTRKSSGKMGNLIGCFEEIG